MEVWKWPNADVQNVNIISNAKAIRRTVNWTKSQPWCERERQMRGECGLNIEEKWAAKYFCYSLNARHNGPATLSCCLESRAIFFVRFFVCCCGVFGARCHRMEIVFRVCSQHTHTQRRISFDRQNAKLYAMRPIWHHHFVCVLHLLLCSLRQQTKHRSRTQYMHMWASPSNHRRIRCIFSLFFFFGLAITLSTDNICRWFMPYFYNIHQNCRRWLCGMCSMRGTWGGEANTEYNVYIAGWNCGRRIFDRRI